MKTLLTTFALSLLSAPAMAADIQCFWGNEAQPCTTAYDIFVSDAACFKGDAQKAASLLGTTIGDDSSLSYLEIQVANENRILIWVNDMGVERMIRVNRCSN